MNSPCSHVLQFLKSRFNHACLQLLRDACAHRITCRQLLSLMHRQRFEARTHPTSCSTHLAYWLAAVLRLLYASEKRCRMCVLIWKLSSRTARTFASVMCMLAGRQMNSWMVCDRMAVAVSSSRGSRRCFSS